ncbi:MAG TPA: hypothetical protein VLA48_02715 [Nitrososphaeraceae archaeon]|nr:hypothetical protein [Nitrososphaeraceae archaeon]
MNITASIASKIGGKEEEIINKNTEIQFYANDNLHVYQWRDSRFEWSDNVWENKQCQTREELIEAFKEHLKSTVFTVKKYKL